MSVELTTEVERKYAVDVEAAVPDLSSLPGAVSVEAPLELEQVSTYYDTTDLRLFSAGISLRHRSGGVDDGWHLKSPTRGPGREEVRVSESSREHPPAALVDRVRGVVREAALGPVTTIRTRRRLVRIRGEDGVLAEFCDDRVAAGSPTSSAPTDEWREWELELVDAPAQLFSAAETLLFEAGAQPSDAPSKLARTVAATLPEPHSWRSRRELGEDPTCVELLSAYLAEHLVRLEDEDGALRAGDQEGVHRLRVAARRLRSALATYRLVLQTDATASLRADLKWLGGELARARDAQVLRERLGELLTAQPDELVLGPVRARLDAALTEKYTSGRATADAALSSDRYFHLLDRLERFVDDPPTDEEGRRRARDVVPDLVAKELKRVRKRHRAYMNAAPERQDPALHEVRKAAKRLRYAAEIARPVFGKRSKRLASRARDVQKVLGEHQDTVVARPVLREIGARAHLAGENGFTPGRLHGLEEGRATELKRAYPDTMSRLLTRKVTRAWG